MVQSQAQPAHVQSPYWYSYQMFLHPNQRGSKDAVRNPILEWIYPLFAVACEVEKTALSRFKTIHSDSDGIESLSHKV